MKVKVFEFENITYAVKYPNNYVEGRKYPTIMYLHGAGNRGNDINMVLTSTYYSVTDEYEDFPFVTVSPQCNETCWFDMFERLKRLAKKISNESFCDAERFYLMGLSMGGYATWQLGISCPELFAAMVPICGGGMNWLSERLVNMPIWAFHGSADERVYPDETRFFVNKINKCGGNAKLTVYEGVDHDCWTQTYQNPEVFAWLLKQRKEKVREATDTYNDREKFG